MDSTKFREDVAKLGPASVLALGSLILPPLGSIGLFYYINDIGQWLRTHGSAGLGMYALGFAILAGLALLPTYASAILGGWAFGFAWGFPAALVGFLGGAAIAYAVCRPTASERVERLIAEKPKWKAVREALVGGTAGKTFLIVALLRLPINSPFAATNLVLSSVRVPLWLYLSATLVGMAPRTGVAVYVASLLSSQSASEVAQERPTWLLVAGIASGVAVLVVIGTIAKRAIERVTRGSA